MVEHVAQQRARPREHGAAVAPAIAAIVVRVEGALPRVPLHEDGTPPRPQQAGRHLHGLEGTVLVLEGPDGVHQLGSAEGQVVEAEGRQRADGTGHMRHVRGVEPVRQGRGAAVLNDGRGGWLDVLLDDGGESLRVEREGARSSAAKRRKNSELALSLKMRTSGVKQNVRGKM